VASILFHLSARLPAALTALGVEELRRPQVRVALGVAGVDARDRGPAGDLRVRGVLLVGIESPPELAEVAPNGGDHHVLDLEGGARVRGVGVPGAGRHADHPLLGHELGHRAVLSMGDRLTRLRHNGWKRSSSATSIANVVRVSRGE
jgi:hypothetical protein